jgi:hypothetical protein
MVMALVSLSNEEWWVVRDACAAMVPPADAQVAILDGALPPRGDNLTDQTEISVAATDLDAYLAATLCSLIWGAKASGAKIQQQSSV